MRIFPPWIYSYPSFKINIKSETTNIVEFKVFNLWGLAQKISDAKYTEYHKTRKHSTGLTSVTGVVKLYLGLPKTNPSGSQTGIFNLGFLQASLLSWQLGHAVSVLANNKMLTLSWQPRVSLAKFTSTTRNPIPRSAYKFWSFWRIWHLYQWAVVLSWLRISCYYSLYANERNFKTINCLECLITTIDSIKGTRL